MHFAGGCWARCQLPNGIRYVPVASRPRKSLSSVEGILGIKLAIFYSMADYSTPNGRNLNLFAGSCWDRCQLPNGIRYISFASKLMKHTLSVFCGEDLYSSPGDLLLDGRLLHNRWTDFDALCGRLLGPPPATQWYRIHLSATFTDDFTGTRLGGRLRTRRPEGGLELERVFCQKAAYEYRCFYVD